MIADLQRQLGIDATFFPQLLIFLVIFVWLQLVYFKPYLKLIQARERQSGGMSDDAAKLEEAAVRDAEAYNSALLAARKKAAQDREAGLAVARAQAAEIVDGARQQAKSKLEHAREGAARAAEIELASLRSQVQGISSLLVEKLTKTKVGL